MLSKTKGILFVVFLLFGMIITMQFRTILLAQQQNAMGQTSIQSLSNELDRVKNEEVQLQDQLRVLEEEYDEIMNQWSNDDNPILNELVKTRREAMLYSGLVDVKGSGVIVTLNDAPARNEMDPNELIIHYIDILKIINELNAAGAQAISVNDERFLATSKLLCTGPTILINQNRYPVPYVIKAIGEPDALSMALEESEAVIIMRVYDIRVDIQKEQEIVIPRYKVYRDIKSMISGLEVVER